MAHRVTTTMATEATADPATTRPTGAVPAGGGHPARGGEAKSVEPRRAGWLPARLTARLTARLPRWSRHPATPPLVTLAAGLAGAVYLWHTDPHEGGQLLPRCPFHWATGLLCPACGGTRMTYDALHGDWSAALHDNAALLLLGVPLAAWLGWRWLSEGLRGRRYRVRLGRRAAAAVLGAALGWALLRNLMG